MTSSRALRLALLAGLAAALGGCQTVDVTAALGASQATPGPGLAATGQPAQGPADAVKDDAALGQEHFAAGHYGLAELHFRRAVEARRGDAEAWVGLAAAYDQLKRWELADRAYAQAIKLNGPTSELLNNRGYSYMLRGDLRRASQDLTAAAAKDPADERIQANLKVLDERARRRR